MSEMWKKAIEGLNVNDTFTVERTFTEQDVMQFADITLDYNPKKSRSKLDPERRATP